MAFEIDKRQVTPLTAGRLDELASTPIVAPIGLLDLQSALASPPFILVPCLPDGATAANGAVASDAPTACLNFRDAWDADRTPDVQPRRVYRCGKSNFSAADLARLGIVEVFDLRADAERQRDGHDLDDARAANVEVIWIEPKPTMLGSANQTSLQGEHQSLLADSYMSILASHRDVFRQIVLNVGKLAADQAILLHCTAGKDRTGVATAMLLSLAGCSDESIAREYALTRIGIEPSRERLMKALQAYTKNQIAVDDQRFRALSESKVEDMALFLQRVRQTYPDGFRGYCTQELQVSDEQIEAAKRNLEQPPLSP